MSIKHVLKTIEMPQHKLTFWCGRTSYHAWYFLDWEHALMAEEQGSLINYCLKCKASYLKTLKQKNRDKL